MLTTTVNGGSSKKSQRHPAIRSHAQVRLTRSLHNVLLKRRFCFAGSHHSFSPSTDESGKSISLFDGRVVTGPLPPHCIYFVFSRSIRCPAPHNAEQISSRQFIIAAFVSGIRRRFSYGAVCVDLRRRTAGLKTYSCSSVSVGSINVKFCILSLGQVEVGPNGGVLRKRETAYRRRRVIANCCRACSIRPVLERRVR